MRERIAMLDCARGMAILGILLMNITAFGLPKAAYLNPAYTGTVSLADAWAWAALDMLAQVKFLTLFALLFGAGLQMLQGRGTRWIRSRLAWLFVIGLLQALLLWDGDILHDYALIGLLCLGAIRQAPGVKTLFRTGIVLYLIGIALLLLFQLLMSHQPPGRFWLPRFDEQIYEYYWNTTGGMEAFQNRLDLLHGSIIALASQYGWQLAGAMLFGAGLMRSGWLSGSFSPAHYRRMAALLIPIGLAVNLPSVIFQWYSGWDYRWCAFLLQIPREISAPLQVLGYVSLLYGYWAQLAPLALTRWVANVGRMALSNYLLQSLICSLLFNHFGLFMQYGRAQLLLFVPAVWVVNIVVSSLWLRVCEQGPVEWLWRRLTRLTGGQQQRIGS